MNFKDCAKLGILIVCLPTGPTVPLADPLTTWKLQSSSVSNHLYAVAAGNGWIVTAGQDGPLIYSSNTVDWTRADFPSSITEISNNPFQRVRFLNGSFVALHWGHAGTNFADQILTSSDGADCSARFRTNLGRTSAILSDAAYGGGTYVVVGSFWHLTSTNLLDWAVCARLSTESAWEGVEG